MRENLLAFLAGRRAVGASARINYGDHKHTGYLVSNNRGGPAVARVRDSRKPGSKQYAPVFERHLGEEVPRLEFQGANGRYHPAVEDLK